MDGVESVEGMNGVRSMGGGSGGGRTRAWSLMNLTVGACGGFGGNGQDQRVNQDRTLVIHPDCHR